MRVLKRNRWLSGLAVLLAGLVVCGGQALADVTTNDTGTVLIFPKVIANGTRDTLIQITNTGNLLTAAHCTYVNAVGQCSISQTSCTRIDVGTLGSPDCPALATPGNSGQCAVSGASCTSDTQCTGGLGDKCLNLARESCLNTCSFEHDFDIFLTAQQPTVWRVSTGRASAPGDDLRGFDPAPGTGVQAVTPDFEGTLRCVETDLTGAITASNKLKGEAVLETIDSGEISEYNAVAIKGSSSPETTIVLDGKSFNACAQTLWLNNYQEGGQDALFGNASVTTELTLVPCSEDLEDGIAIQSSASLTFVTEEELAGDSNIIPFNCYLNATLGDLDPGSVSIATQFNKTKIVPSTDHVCFSGNVGLPCSGDGQCGTIVPGWGCRQRPGLIGVAEEFHHIGSNVGTAAVNLHQDGARPGDTIVIQSPACGDIDQPCCSGTGCFNGSCQAGLCEP
jgi:hypothetical protein